MRKLGELFESALIEEKTSLILNNEEIGSLIINLWYLGLISKNDAKDLKDILYDKEDDDHAKLQFVIACRLVVLLKSKLDLEKNNIDALIKKLNEFGEVNECILMNWWLILNAAPQIYKANDKIYFYNNDPDWYDGGLCFYDVNDKYTMNPTFCVEHILEITFFSEDEDIFYLKMNSFVDIYVKYHIDSGQIEYCKGELIGVIDYQLLGYDKNKIFNITTGKAICEHYEFAEYEIYNDRYILVSPRCLSVGFTPFLLDMQGILYKIPQEHASDILAQYVSLDLQNYRYDKGDNKIFSLEYLKVLLTKLDASKCVLYNLLIEHLEDVLEIEPDIDLSEFFFKLFRLSFCISKRTGLDKQVVDRITSSNIKYNGNLDELFMDILHLFDDKDIKESEVVKGLWSILAQFDPDAIYIGTFNVEKNKYNLVDASENATIMGHYFVPDKNRSLSPGIVSYDIKNKKHIVTYNRVLTKDEITNIISHFVLDEDDTDFIVNSYS